MTNHSGGRPRKDPMPGERVGLSFRITADMKRRLDAAAQQSGRSLSQETERLLELGMIFETMMALGHMSMAER